MNLDAQTEPRARILGLKENPDRLLQMTSLGHSMAIENTLAQFLAGGAVIATGGFDPTEYLRWLSELGPNWYDCSPTVHQAALAQLKRTPLDRSISIRFVQSAGAPLPSEVRQELEQILSVPVLNDYGMTETGPIATDAFLPYERIPNSAGRSCGLEISIVGALGEALQTDEEGEIAVRGPAVFSAYAGNSESTRAAFRNGWFLTGDAGRLDAEGNLFISGTASKEMFNRGGQVFAERRRRCIARSSCRTRCSSFCRSSSDAGRRRSLRRGFANIKRTACTLDRAAPLCSGTSGYIQSSSPGPLR